MCPPKRREPERLRQGKAFHKKVQKDWRQNAEGDVRVEKAISKPPKLAARKPRTGRVDVYVDDGDMVAVMEIKCSDWDRMTLRAVNRNVRRQIRQIWDYIESQLHTKDPSTTARDVCPGVTFPKRPTSKERLNVIERLFEKEGIPVVWDDESIEERKVCAARS